MKKSILLLLAAFCVNAVFAKTYYFKSVCPYSSNADRGSKTINTESIVQIDGAKKIISLNVWDKNSKIWRYEVLNIVSQKSSPNKKYFHYTTKNREGGSGYASLIIEGKTIEIDITLDIFGDKYLLKNPYKVLSNEVANKQAPFKKAVTRSIWQGNYETDDFGDKKTNCPYVYGEIERGDEIFQLTVSNCQGVIIGYHRAFDFMGLAEAKRVSIKAQNGQVYKFNFTERNTSLYITNKNEINTMLGLFSQGYFTLSIGFESGSYILKVTTETCDWQSVYQSLRR